MSFALSNRAGLWRKLPRRERVCGCPFGQGARPEGGHRDGTYASNAREIAERLFANAGFMAE